MDALGVTLCLQFAFPPNSLHYCGPEKQADIRGYLETHTHDSGLGGILSQFETLYPYLQLIASANRIKDPFDTRVVEAYWLGNRLLSRVPKREFHSHLVDRLGVAKKIRKQKISTMDTLMTFGFPHHTFHVLTIYVRTGAVAVKHTLHTMDSCRIGWGRVTTVNSKTGIYTIMMPHLKFQKDRLVLDTPISTSVSSVDGTYTVGDIVSVHWGYICGVLSAGQLNSLSSYTNEAIKAANSMHISA